MLRLLSAIGLAAMAALPARATVDIVPVTSPGGIQAWLVEDPSIPFMALEIRFQGGASLDPEGKRGATYLMTGLLEEGAGDLDSQAFAARSEELAASISFDVYDDALSISTRFLTETRDATIAHLRAALVDTRFDQDAIERVRAQVLQGIENKAKDPEDIASATFSGLAYGNHPYATGYEGTLESVAALSRDDLIAARDAVIARDRIFVGASGDITGPELGVLLDRLFSDLPETGGSMPKRADLTLTGGVTVVDYETPQSVALFGQPGLARDHPDFFPAFILNQVMGGGGFSSRLMEEVREKRGLTYGIGSYLVAKDHAELYLGQFSSDNARVAEAIDVVKAEWARMGAEGLTQDDLDSAKTYLTGAYPLRFDGNGRIANIMVGMQMDGLGLDYIPTRNDKVRAVTLEQINAVAARLMQPEELRFVVVGQPKGLEPVN